MEAHHTVPVYISETKKNLDSIQREKNYLQMTLVFVHGKWDVSYGESSTVVFLAW